MSVETPVLEIRKGPAIQLPKRKNLLGGLRFERFLSSPEIHPYEEIQWEKRDIRIMDWKTGQPRFERLGVEVPTHWDDNACTIVTDKYLFGRDPGTLEFEDSFQQVFDRIANTYTVWGWEEGYFATLEDVDIFNEELKAMLVRQMWAPNSPVWFNIGHWEQWRWGRPDLRPILGGRGNKAYHATGETQVTYHEVDNVYNFPQCSACFLTEVEDDMESILEHIKTEGRVFASGSGVGINISSIRSSYEPITGKGRSSGPVSFDRGWDRMAGAVKSGGKTRRAARMVIMYGDHPDVFKFLNSKNEQEKIAKIILREHNVRAKLVEIARKKRVDGTPAERVASEIILNLPATNDEVYDNHMDGLLYGETLSNQNANHSISLKGDFWQAYKTNGEYSTRWVSRPETIEDTFKAEYLLDAMASSVWDNGEPGQHNNDWINLWNPVKHDGDISTSNPCSEYLHLNNTSCNLASFNAYRLLDPENNEFDPEHLIHMTRISMVCADLNIERGGFPIPEIAVGTRTYRTTGLGYANVGGALMALGIPYDSDEGRWIAGQLASLLTAASFKASAELGREIGPYPAFSRTKDDLKEIVALHHCCQEVANIVPISNEKRIYKKIDALWKTHRKDLPKAQGINGRDALVAMTKSYEDLGGMNTKRIQCANKIALRASEIWKELQDEEVFRNSFVSVMAPTGTISAPLGCYDEGTTSIEPDYTLVKIKSLSGGGMLKMFNRLALKGLQSLGYDNNQVSEAAFECAGLDGLLAACGGVSTVAKHLSQVPGEDQQGEVRKSFTRLAKGRVTPTQIEGLVVDLRSRSMNGDLTADEYLVINGKSHLEGVPFIHQNDLAAFDCSVSNGDGQRSISAEGHMRMLGAIQPFISGASSKTVNLPYSATTDDIKNCFVMCHDMGVKCIALFRAESKANSVYQVDTPEGRKYHPENVWQKLVESADNCINDSIAEAAKPRRKKLRGRRLAQTVKFMIGGGQLRGYLTFGIYPDGRCGEIFGRVGQTGTFASGLLEAYCKSISVALQYGVPLDEIIHDFRYMAFEPSGFAQVGDDNETGFADEIKSCSSLVDLIMRILDWMFPGPERRLADMPNGQMLFTDTKTGPASATIVHKSNGHDHDHGNGNGKGSKPNTTTINSAIICPKCTQMTYIQDGKCRRCVNAACGYKDGGCGE